MKYCSGEEVRLGDIVLMPVPSGESLFRVVMISGEPDHLILNNSFLAWVNKDRQLGANEIVLEWVEENTLKHNNPNYAPVGDQMFTEIDNFIKLVRRNNPE